MKIFKVPPIRHETVWISISGLFHKLIDAIEDDRFDDLVVDISLKRFLSPLAIKRERKIADGIVETTRKRQALSHL